MLVTKYLLIRIREGQEHEHVQEREQEQVSATAFSNACRWFPEAGTADTEHLLILCLAIQMDKLEMLIDIEANIILVNKNSSAHLKY